MRLLSYNIWFGGKRREDLLAQAIRQARPDLVVFQEAIHPSVVEKLARETELPHWASRPQHSIGFLSRLPIAHHAWVHPRGSKHPYLEIVPEGLNLRVVGLHLTARFSSWNERQREREVNAMLDCLAEHAATPHLLVGDFNALAPDELLDPSRFPAWIRALIWISGRKVTREAVSAMLSRGYLDCFRTLYPADPGHTFPVWDPHLRLDYCFVPSACRGLVTSMQVLRDDLTRRASDHFPVLIELEPARH